MFLTHKQLTDLTDSHRKAGQIRWLTDNGVPFVLSVYGRPKVLVEEIEARLLSSKKKTVKVITPRFDLIKSQG